MIKKRKADEIDVQALDVEQKVKIPKSDQENKETKSPALNPLQVVKFNVGGTKIETTISTLLGTESTWLVARALERRLEEKRGFDEEFFFDADPTVFTSILAAMRSKQLFLPPPSISIETVMQQLDFWGLPWLSFRQEIMQHEQEHEGYKYIAERFRNLMLHAGDLPQSFHTLVNMKGCLDFVIPTGLCPNGKNHHETMLREFLRDGGTTDHKFISWPTGIFPQQTPETWHQNGWATANGSSISSLRQEMKCATFEQLANVRLDKEPDLKDTVTSYLDFWKQHSARNLDMLTHHLASVIEGFGFQCNESVRTSFQQLVRHYGFECKIKKAIIRCDIFDESTAGWLWLPGWMFDPIAFDEYMDALSIRCAGVSHEPEDIHVFKFQITPIL